MKYFDNYKTVSFQYVLYNKLLDTSNIVISFKL